MTKRLNKQLEIKVGGNWHKIDFWTNNDNKSSARTQVEDVRWSDPNDRLSVIKIERYNIENDIYEACLELDRLADEEEKIINQPKEE